MSIVPYISRPAPYTPIGSDWWLAQRGLSWSTMGADFRLRKFWLASGVSGAATRWATEAEFAAQYTAAGTTSRTYFDQAGVIQNDLAANALRYTWVGGVRRLLLERAVTNEVLNSGAMATQTVTVTAAQRTLSFYGTGTVTLSGVATGALVGTGTEDRVSLMFTPIAGSLTLTVTGSVLYAQLEMSTQGTGYATSYIPTGASAVTRPIETLRLPTAVETLMATGPYTLLVQGQLLGITSGSNHSRIVGAGSGFSVISVASSGVQGIITYTGGAELRTATQTGAPLTTGYGAALCEDASGRSLSLSGNIISDTGRAATPAPHYLARDGAGRYGDGYYDLFAIGPTRLTNAQLQAAAVPYV